MTWQVHDDWDGVEVVSASNVDNVICTLPFEYKNEDGDRIYNKTNATLIAAAPDLLASLKTLLEETEYFAPANGAATLAAKAAIAKAEGRTP